MPPIWCKTWCVVWGTAAGHQQRSGGRIPKVANGNANMEDLCDEVRSRWLAACAVDRKRGTRLVAQTRDRQQSLESPILSRFPESLTRLFRLSAFDLNRLVRLAKTRRRDETGTHPFEPILSISSMPRLCHPSYSSPT